MPGQGQRLGGNIKRGDSGLRTFRRQRDGNTAGAGAKSATLYVTLEPCAHFGKTPPCTQAIIKAGIKRVVIATLDLNPHVSGVGVKELQIAGIDVEIGLCATEAQELNRPFFHFIQHKTPYITLKAGMSLDSKLATVSGESKWITNAESRQDAHALRQIHDAILVGIGTVLADNPSLTTRMPSGGKNPIRIILDTHLRTPLESAVVTDNQAPTWIVIGAQVPETALSKFERYSQVKIIRMPGDTIDLNLLLTKLGAANIMSLLVEGGHKVHTDFIRHKLINQVVLYVSPQLIGGKEAPMLFSGSGFSSLAETLKLKFTRVENLGDNLKVTAEIQEEA